MNVMSTTVTQKGQITLPKAVRDFLNIDVFDVVLVKTAKDHAKIYPTKDILDYAGKYKAKKGQSALKAREYMETHYRRV
ncbi:AbrB/MazE/SpoVT family DNA-binding domain-containing protein [Microgenomates group bacterium]|nr:AbrB/MazE/SpoVT family DNA-binding domain-containing protein [Microgenomates group bacterium]